MGLTHSHITVEVGKQKAEKASDAVIQGQGNFSNLRAAFPSE